MSPAGTASPKQAINYFAHHKRRVNNIAMNFYTHMKGKVDNSYADTQYHNACRRRQPQVSNDVLTLMTVIMLETTMKLLLQISHM